jgi:hypothetical protein
VTGPDRPSPRSQLVRLGFGDTDSADTNTNGAAPEEDR